MKREQSLKIMDAEIAKWQRFKDIINFFEKGIKYKIRIRYYEWDDKNKKRLEKEHMFIGMLREFNKSSINFEVLTVEKVDRTSFQYKLSNHNRDLENARNLLAGETPKWGQTEEWAKRIVKKPFSCSVKLEDFLEWDVWEFDPVEGPLLINNEFVSEKMKKELFGV